MLAPANHFLLALTSAIAPPSKQVQRATSIGKYGAPHSRSSSGLQKNFPRLRIFSPISHFQFMRRVRTPRKACYFFEKENCNVSPVLSYTVERQIRDIYRI